MVDPSDIWTCTTGTSTGDEIAMNEGPRDVLVLARPNNVPDDVWEEIEDVFDELKTKAQQVSEKRKWTDKFKKQGSSTSSLRIGVDYTERISNLTDTIWGTLNSSRLSR